MNPDIRIQYLQSQQQYYKFFAQSSVVKNDPDLYDYKRKMTSEMQLRIIRDIHKPILIFGLMFGAVRMIKSGYSQPVICGLMWAAFHVHSLYNTSMRFPFEVAYPAHPIVIEKRNEAIRRWWYYDPEIIKFELEYLNKKVYKDGYKREFETSKGNKYQVAIEDSELFINCIDDFENIFEFKKDVLLDNNLMDVLSPEDFASHKKIGEWVPFNLYSREYLLSISGFLRRIFKAGV